MKVGVVGHVEWVSFFGIDDAIAPGAIVRASPGVSEAAGGGAVAAVELARLAGASTLFTALGDDELGRAVPEALAAHGVDVRAVWREEPHRRAMTFVDPDGERTIVVVGPAQSAPASIVDVTGFDGIYFCKGDAEAARKARGARVLCATARVLSVLQEARVQLDVLVHSANDRSEHYSRGDLDPEPLVVATTEGAHGGRFTTRDGRSGRWGAVELSGPIVDTYGAGDSFAAALTFAMARGDAVEEALGFAAQRGAAALRRRAAHGS